MTNAHATHDDLLRYMPLVLHIAARFQRRVPANVLRDDLVAAGSWGLVDSLRKNGPERGARFEAYARIRIRGAILDELRSQDWLPRGDRRRAVASDTGGTAWAMGVVGFEDVRAAREVRYLPGSLPSPLDSAEQSAVHEALVRVIDQTLVDREREIVGLHYFQGVEFKDIADRLGVSAPRVSQLHARAMDKLRAALSSAATLEAA